MNKSICSVVSNYCKEEVIVLLKKYGKCVDFLSNPGTCVDNAIFIGSIERMYEYKPERCDSNSNKRYGTLVLYMESWIRDKDVKHINFRVIFLGEIVNQLLDAKVKKGNAIAILEPHFFTALNIPSLTVGPNNAIIWVFKDLKDEIPVNIQQSTDSTYNCNSECSKSTYSASLPRDHQVYRSQAVNLNDICLNSNKEHNKRAKLSSVFLNPMEETESQNQNFPNRLKPIKETPEMNCILSQNTAHNGSVNEIDHQDKSFEFAFPVSSKHYERTKKYPNKVADNSNNSVCHNRSCNKHQFDCCSRSLCCPKEKMCSCCRQEFSCSPSFCGSCSCQCCSHTGSCCHSQPPVISCSHGCRENSHISHFNDSIRYKCQSERRCCHMPANGCKFLSAKQNHHCSRSQERTCCRYVTNTKTSRCCSHNNSGTLCSADQPVHPTRGFHSEHCRPNKESALQSLERLTERKGNQCKIFTKQGLLSKQQVLPTSCFRDRDVTQRIKQWVQDWSPSPVIEPQYNCPSSSGSKEVEKNNQEKTNECQVLALENDCNTKPLGNSTPLSKFNKRTMELSSNKALIELEKNSKIKKKKRKLFNYDDFTSIIEEKSVGTIEESISVEENQSCDNDAISIHDASIAVNFDSRLSVVDENQSHEHNNMQVNVENSDQPVVSFDHEIESIPELSNENLINSDEVKTGKESNHEDAAEVVEMEDCESISGNEININDANKVDDKQKSSDGSFPQLNLEPVSNGNESEKQSCVVSLDTNSKKSLIEENACNENVNIVNESHDSNSLNSISEVAKNKSNSLLSLSLSDYGKINELNEGTDRTVVQERDNNKHGSNENLFRERSNQSGSEESFELISKSSMNKRQKRNSLSKSPKLLCNPCDSFDSDKSNETVCESKENPCGTQSVASSTGTFCDALSEVQSSQQSKKSPLSEKWCKKLIEDMFDENVAQAFAKILPRSPNKAIEPNLYDTCDISGVIIDIVPDIKADRFSIMQGFCHEGCRNTYKFEEFSSLEEIDHTCSACKYKFHFTCPGCKSRGFQYAVCIFFSFEIHLLDENNVWRIEVEHADAVKFLGCSPTLYIKTNGKLSKKLEKLIVPIPTSNLSSAIVLKGTIKAKMKLGSKILTFHNTTLKTNLYLDGSHYKYTCSK